MGRRLLLKSVKNSTKQSVLVKNGVKTVPQLMKLVSIGGVRLNVLVISTTKAYRGRFRFNKAYGCVDIVAMYFYSYAAVATYLKLLSTNNIRYDCIVLAPDHGVEDYVDPTCGAVTVYAKCEWRHGDRQSYMVTELNLCYSITNNVHYCTCSRAPHIETVLKAVRLSKKGIYYCSGYVTYITGYEKSTFSYIKAGCPVDASKFENENLRVFKKIK
jgi:hypothetical protein